VPAFGTAASHSRSRVSICLHIRDGSWTSGGGYGSGDPRKSAVDVWGSYLEHVGCAGCLMVATEGC